MDSWGKIDSVHVDQRSVAHAPKVYEWNVGLLPLHEEKKDQQLSTGIIRREEKSKKNIFR